ncbi:DUF1993 domain-containing protein [Alteromonas flava]|uniref:DUF1993 domain-containing protein n=1 Tax=Alteromonas flava TaxID=2048003 RepID=UPI000C2954A7|nr:DUF1993 domain-containing protein [Alteromonas flava]
MSRGTRSEFYLCSLNCRWYAYSLLGKVFAIGLENGTRILTTTFDCFLRYLRNLQVLINKIERATPEPDSLLSARLHPSMLPLRNQIQITANFPLRALCPLLNTAVVSFDNQARTFTDMQLQVAETIHYIESHAGNISNTNVLIKDSAGSATIEMPAMEYLNLFALPNFYFHFSMVYAIARAEGIALTKGDFDGIHAYPTGFSFA